MTLLLDVGIVALVVMFAISGYKKGLLISLVNVAGTIIACALAPLVSSVFSTMIYDSFIKNEITESVSKAAEGIPANIGDIERLTEIISKLPNSINNMLSFVGVQADGLAADVASTKLEIPEIIEGIVRPNAMRLISTVLTVILFIIISVGLKFAAGLATKALEAVKLGTINKMLGGVFGIAESAFIIMMVTLLVYFVMMFMSPEGCAYVNDRINETVLYKIIYQYSMPDAIIALFLPK